MKKIMNFTAILFMLAILAGMTLALEMKKYASNPLPGGSEEKIVTIPAGRGFDPVLQVLQDSGFSLSPFKFRVMAVALGYDKKIKAGEYQLKLNMTPLEILENLVSGKERLHRVTIPEGYTAIQIAELLEKNGWPVKDEFMDLCKDSRFIASLGIQAQTLEGYLFPDTYYFPSKTTAEKIIVYMTGKFKTVFVPEWIERARSMGFSVHQTLILASIIEKETGASAERPLIASVFHNRLKKNMRLESDPTVIYGIDNFDGNITRKHLQTSTPYNTYKMEGLPRGPIANPGMESMKAALFPLETDFLFFVSKNDGTHHFTTRKEDHDKAVEKYQRRRVKIP